MASKKIAKKLDQVQALPVKPTNAMDESVGDKLVRISFESIFGGSKVPPPPVFVYFVRAGDLIKIGKASDVDARIRGIQGMSPEPIDLLCFYSADDKEESRLHAKFKSCRVRHEWFRATDELLAFIAGIQDTQRGYKLNIGAGVSRIQLEDKAERQRLDDENRARFDRKLKEALDDTEPDKSIEWLPMDFEQFSEIMESLGQALDLNAMAIQENPDSNFALATRGPLLLAMHSLKASLCGLTKDDPRRKLFDTCFEQVEKDLAHVQATMKSRLATCN